MPMISMGMLSVAVGVVASPRLLEAPCNRIEQLRLVNTLCFVKAYADA